VDDSGPLTHLDEEPRAPRVTTVEIEERTRYMAAEFHLGPLPHPDYYERYAAIIPNGAERIIAMAEREQTQRHLMERFGMASAFVLALVFLVAGSILVLSGHDQAGTVIITGTVLGLAGVFITGRLPDLIRRSDGSRERSNSN
jgi:uncharacterized membrane protein